MYIMGSNLGTLDSICCNSRPLTKATHQSMSHHHEILHCCCCQRIRRGALQGRYIHLFRMLQPFSRRFLAQSRSGLTMDTSSPRKSLQSAMLRSCWVLGAALLHFQMVVSSLYPNRFSK